tara:strand:+ start:181 stop:447 length:267 start_codon:yes stop_codon:yes gene_type:complete
MYSKYLIFIIFFLQPVNAKETLNNQYKDNFKGYKSINKTLNEDFYCFKSTRKYIAGEKSFTLNFAGVKINFLNFDGYKKVNKYKCILK